MLIDLNGESLDADDSARKSHDNVRQSHDLTGDNARQSCDLTAVDDISQSQDLKAVNDNTGQSHDLGVNSGPTLASQLERNLLEFEGGERHGQQPSLSPADTSFPQQSQELF